MRGFLSRSALVLMLLTSVAAQSALDLDGHPVEPIAPGKLTVLIFVRSDCPVSNRYAPEINRLATEYKARANFWLVYSDKSETAASINAHLKHFNFKAKPVRDPEHSLVKRVHATITPEAALFSSKGELLYHGRIDDRYVSLGKSRPSATQHDLRDAIAAALNGKTVANTYMEPVGCYIADLNQ